LYNIRCFHWMGNWSCQQSGDCECHFLYRWCLWNLGLLFSLAQSSSSR
jgi:hypothetical protein